MRFEATNGLEVTPVFGVRLVRYAAVRLLRRRARGRYHLDAVAWKSGVVRIGRPRAA